MSDTPRTDAEIGMWIGQEVGFDRIADRARTLESDLAEALAVIVECDSSTEDAWNNWLFRRDALLSKHAKGS